MVDTRQDLIGPHPHHGLPDYAVTDRALVYLADTTASRELRWVNRDGTTGGAIGTVPAGALQDPRLSPDGSRVLVTRDGDIWIYDLASGRGSPRHEKRPEPDGCGIPLVLGWHIHRAMAASPKPGSSRQTEAERRVS
jgi:hypothetical protein